MKFLFNKLALWILRKTGYWDHVNTIEGWRRNPELSGEINHHRFVAYEQGRHRLLMKLIRNEL